MPKSVINRANEILNIYEGEKGKKTIPKRTEQVAFNFIDNKNDEIINELKNINILNITPIESMNILNKLIEKTKK